MNLRSYPILSAGLRLLLLATLLVPACPASAQQPPTSREHPAFAAGDFAGYLAQTTAALAREAPDALPFETVTRLAVALERTGAWGAEPDTDLRAALARHRAERSWLDGLRLLLREEPQGMLLLFGIRDPEPRALTPAVAVLRAQAYPFAANALGALALSLPGKRIVALASIPPDKRRLILRAMLDQTPAPHDRLMLARAALQLFTHPPDGVAIPPRDFYDIALTLGEGTNFVSFETARDLLQYGKTEEAGQMMLQVAQAGGDDISALRRAALMLAAQEDPTALLDFYRQQLGRAPNPQGRWLRMDYLQHLKRLERQEELLAVQAGTDPLFAADAFLMNGQREEAAARYAAIVAARRARLAPRLGAWIGLLETDPARALRAGSDLVAELARVDPEAREPLVTWTGRMFWEIVQREIPPAPGRGVWAVPYAYRPLREVEGWEASAAAVAAGLLEADLLACMKVDTRYPPGAFRYPAALLFALAGDADAALEILTRPVAYDVPPPPGGWRLLDGTLRPDGDKPQRRVTPTSMDRHTQTLQLLEALSRCPRADERLPPLAALLAPRLAAELGTDLPDREFTQRLQELDAVLKYTVMALDPLPARLRTDLPPPPVRAVEMARFAPVDAAVRAALAHDRVGPHAPQLTRNGLRDALLTASNPELLNALVDLAALAFRRYGETGQPPHSVNGVRQLLMGNMKVRVVYDMTPYIERLAAAADQ